MSTPLRTPSALEIFRITFSNPAIPGKARGYFPEDFRKQGSFIVLTGSRAYSYTDEEHRGGKEQAKLLEAGALKRAGEGESMTLRRIRSLSQLKERYYLTTLGPSPAKGRPHIQ